QRLVLDGGRQLCVVDVPLLGVVVLRVGLAVGVVGLVAGLVGVVIPLGVRVLSVQVRRRGLRCLGAQRGHGLLQLGIGARGLVEAGEQRLHFATDGLDTGAPVLGVRRIGVP